MDNFGKKAKIKKAGNLNQGRSMVLQLYQQLVLQLYQQSRALSTKLDGIKFKV